MTNLAGGVGAKDFGSARNLGLGRLVIVVIIFFNRSGRGIGRIGAITFGLGAGYVVAGLAGSVDFRPVREADWLLFPTPFHYGFSFDLRFLVPP
jgi:xanthine/uracil permease